ncbi:unnamed protein product [Ceratitis capitata]|uniref:(Mediterranean fruit fly) hypothetical protein n=1 Tax=Ceratitis capitata TaxID=7213 RepID=A0A811UV80_CERCA|nr:unnamed protein product [Ceratitis capitata]
MYCFLYPTIYGSTGYLNGFHATSKENEVLDGLQNHVQTVDVKGAGFKDTELGFKLLIYI